MRTRTIALIALALASPAGCASRAVQEVNVGAPALAIPVVAPTPIARVERPAAMANGEAIPGAAVDARAREMVGAEVLDELVLETAIREALRERGITVTEEAIAGEEALLARLMAEGSAGGGEQSQSVAVERARARRGLGEIRWRALLWRSAALRALVADEVRVEPGAARRLFDARHGERRIVRVIAVRTQAELAAVQERLAAGDRFESVAMAMSIDPSAALGGLVGPVGRADPAIPASLREGIWGVDEGGVTTPILLPTSIVIARVDRALPPDELVFESVQPELERDALLRAQRAAMESLTARLRAKSRVTILDRTLEPLPGSK